MAGNKELKDLLDDLNNDIAHKNEQPKLSVQPHKQTVQSLPDGGGFLEAHRKMFIGVVVGLVALVGVYQIGVNSGKTDSRSIVKSSTANDEKQIQNVTKKIDAQIERAQANSKNNYMQVKPKQAPKKYSETMTDVSQAGDFLVSYFKNIDNKNYVAAWNQLSPEWRTHFTSIDTYSAMYKDTLSQDIEILEVTRVGNDRAVVRFKLTAVDRTDTGTKRQFFAGKWDIIKQDGKLYMDNPDVKKL